ncbi:hypothetical protein B0H14DRAFT_2914049 [Mycena olivaceomarginata]|nr:hypothetical protein B0H14DRAFT_2914049 [Mycena olivaceomarginata]
MAVLMFVLITTRCIIDTYRCVVAFDNADIDFGHWNTTLGLVTNACWFFLTPIADAFMIFRTFLIWNRNWLIVIPPTVLCFANLGSSIWASIALAKFEMEDSVWGNRALKSMNLFLSLTLCTNIICTGLIAFRILRIHHQIGWVSGSGPTYTMRVVSAIVESAALYTLLLLGALISNSVNSYTNFILFNCTPPTIGLIFSYIIIRVSRETSYGDETITVSTGTVRFGNATTHTYEPDQSAPGVVQVRLEHGPELVEASICGSQIGKHAEKEMV